MKYLLSILICLSSLAVYSQGIPDGGLNRVRIALPDKTIFAELNPCANPRTKSNLFYYWYEANAVHSTQGGFSGKVLNGAYTEYYLNKNLKQQGSLKKGLKDGIWKSWNEDGTLVDNSLWKNGVQVTQAKVPLWKRLNPFKKGKGSHVPDTVKKSAS